MVSVRYMISSLDLGWTLMHLMFSIVCMNLTGWDDGYLLLQGHILSF
jgi:hypothetical protein